MKYKLKDRNERINQFEKNIDRLLEKNSFTKGLRKYGTLQQNATKKDSSLSNEKSNSKTQNKPQQLAVIGPQDSTTILTKKPDKIVQSLVAQTSAANSHIDTNTVDVSLTANKAYFFESTEPSDTCVTQNRCVSNFDLRIRLINNTIFQAEMKFYHHDKKKDKEVLVSFYLKKQYLKKGKISIEFVKKFQFGNVAYFKPLSDTDEILAKFQGVIHEPYINGIIQWNEPSDDGNSKYMQISLRVKLQEMAY